MLTAEHSLMFMLFLTDKYSPSPIFCQQKGENKRKKRRKNIHRFAGASCLTRTGDTLINSQVL